MNEEFSRFYRSRIKQSVDDDRLEIAQAFHELIKAKAAADLRLVNYYKGLPINYPASLVEISRGVLEVDVHQQQAVALEQSGFTFIKCDRFDSAILAEVQNVNVRRMAAALRNFVFVDIMAERRSALRLELEHPMEAELLLGAQSLPGRILDVSVGGASIQVDEQAFQDGAELKLRLVLPDLLQNSVYRVEVEGKHVATSKVNDAAICRFIVSPNVQGESIISRFMFQRQVELIRELKEKSLI
ncbi:pilus protein PilZ [Geomonas sp. Red276]